MYLLVCLFQELSTQIQYIFKLAFSCCYCYWVIEFLNIYTLGIVVKPFSSFIHVYVLFVNVCVSGETCIWYGVRVGGWVWQLILGIFFHCSFTIEAVSFNQTCNSRIPLVLMATLIQRSHLCLLRLESQADNYTQPALQGF